MRVAQTDGVTDTGTPRSGHRPIPLGWLLAGGGVLAAGVVVVTAVLAGTTPYEVLGNSDPGPLVRIGTPLLRLVADGAAMLCTGSLAFATCFTTPQPSGMLSAQGYAAVRSAGRWAVLWCVAVLALLPFDAGDLAGQPLSDVLVPQHLLGLVVAMEEPKAWLVTAAIALLVTICCRLTLRWQPVVALLPLAILGLLPPLATGHSSSDVGHDFATAAIMIHVPVAAVWIGVLAVLLGQVRRRGARLPDLTRRYARLAGVCWLILAASGLVDAAVLVPPADLVHTGYGLLLLGKVVLVAALGVLGARLRRRATRGLGDGAGPVLRLAVGELVVLAGTVAASVALTHLPAPAFGAAVTGQQTLIGYNLAGSPTLLRLVTDLRFDVLFGPVALGLAAGYLYGVRRLRQRGGRWPLGRTACWLAGCLVLLVATCSGIGRYAPAMFSVHIAAHMLLAMLVPVLLALGGPLTLAQQVLPSASQEGLLGPREWLARLADSPAVRVATHPIVALTLFAGSPFLLYFSGLFDAAVRFHWADMAINVYFLVAGYLFAWPVVGVDRLPRPMPNLARLGMLLAAMPFDTVFAAMVITTHRVIGNGAAGGNMYQALALPWVHSLLADQRLGGVIALILGEVPLVVAVVALLFRWSGTDQRTGAGGDDEQVDYQAVIARLVAERR